MVKKKPVGKPSSSKQLKSRPIVQKEHPWRQCPVGHHWVRPQVKHREPSKRHPDGVVPYGSFCRLNPSRKSSIYPEELGFISEKYFKGLGKTLSQDPDFKKRDQFDDLIVGWTKYWNDIFKPTELLEAELVKALIATESSFNIKVKDKDAGKAGKARGILQVTDEAQKAMNESTSEINDYLVHVTRKELKDPNLNIAAGVRWLFHKKALTDSMLGRPSSWYEAIIFYKGYRDAYLAGKSIQEMSGADKINKAYKRITGKDLKK